MSFVVPYESLESWLAELKPYQRNTLQQFLIAQEPEKAAEMWLTTIGSPNIAGFGGVASDPKPFWVRFKAECHRFVCDETAYSDDKKAFLSKVPVSKDVLISVMSGAIGANLGTAGTLVAPAVTLILFTVGRIGLNAYCSPN